MRTVSLNLLTVSFSVCLCTPINALSLHHNVGRTSFLPTRSSPIASNTICKSRFHQFSSGQRRTPSSSSLSMIFERMSEECIGSLVTAQNESARLGQSTVGCEVMTLGIIDRPEKARRTLKSYGITLRKAKLTVETINNIFTMSPQLLNMNKKARDVELPFAPALKRVLTFAGAIADSLDSPTVNSEHVLLALMEGVDSTTFSAAEFCRRLVMDIKYPNEPMVGEGPQLVSGNGGELSTPTLSEVGVDLTDLAARMELDPVHGRDEEVRAALRTLVRRRKNNPCLMGEPGVGKTAIAEGVAQILAAPNMLRNHRIISLELANLVAGTKYRGEFEERLQAIVEEVTDERAPPTILFIDEIHTLVGAGSAEGGIDAANMLKPALARGKLQVIGATTISEYRKYIEKDAALERRLQPLMVKEPTIDQTVQILEAIAEQYGAHHGVRYTPESLVAAAKLSERYVTDRFLPDKAIDLLDEAGASVHIEHAFNPSGSTNTPEVTDQDISSIISQWTNIPIGKLTSTESSTLLTLESSLASRVKGQERAIKSIARAVRRARSGLRDAGRPVASFLFCGSTGVGKTWLAKSLAAQYYGSEKDMVRIDMSEYMEKHTASRLTGPPPGYVGYEEGGQLTEAVRRAPHSVVLLDEIEKAHRDVLNVLLQVMEDGVLTDGKGRTICFKNVILVMTSNVGSAKIMELVNGDAGEFDSDTTSLDAAEDYAALSEVVQEELTKEMKPELLNRIDEIIVFSPLGDENLRDIAKAIVDASIERAFKERSITLSASDSLIDAVVMDGSMNAAEFGARPMRRAAQRLFEDAVSDAIVRGFLQEDDHATVDMGLSTSASGMPTVVIMREKDGELLVVDVDDGSGGIGMAASSRKVNGLDRQESDELKTEMF
ncbi:member of the clp superfamily, regulatory gamma subunit [Thalassiosira pseudonana CCMP1335]|uniref:Member of the clp superfamily, regulatory gamma subunit n=1 Tax=Thalassiosira pseudonana TaxID=35128 RepID=B8BXC6_THAPS|nr:member of the clp superfamily, regulatory gamma subunit [Thalassiosira pseudonana CCMP1335]EED94182.1 member of the clp superfamily, regulatory gamma subunit [Thalassiosira pseudonana CCMP1335]